MNVVPLPKSDCDRFVIAKHYSRRASIFWAGFGLEIDGKIEGVCVYGQPSAQVQKSAFKERAFKFYELARLVIQTAEKNAASLLVGRSLQMLDAPCAVVSYADTEHGHAGIVYQATNWIYTGAVTSHDAAYLVDGKRVHPMTLRDRGITKPKEWARENGVQFIPPKPKHRYFFFVGDRRQRRSMLVSLAYPAVEPYPKLPKQRYDDGERIELAVEKNLFS